MDATTLAPDAPLPADVATLQAMVRELLTELQKLRAENAELKSKLDAALKHRFGRRSEQRRQREEQRRTRRQRDAEPMWDELSKWLADQKPGALPKSPLGTAIGYASNNWSALKRYLERGFLALDNNLSERTLRAIALGRNAWGVIGSEVGGKTAAVLYSIVGTCKHLGIDPFAYLRETLPGLFALGEKPTTERLLDWLPDRWLLNRARDQPIREVGAG